MSVSIDSDTSIVEHDYNNSKKSRQLTETDEPRIIYINSNEDLKCLYSTSGGLIKRILRSTHEIEIPPKYGVLVQTQIFHPSNSEKWYVTNALMSYAIKKFDDYWLSKETELQLSIKEGEISPRYNGKIQVAVFNKSSEKIIITKNSAIANLITKIYPYMSPLPPKYKSDYISDYIL